MMQYLYWWAFLDTSNTEIYVTLYYPSRCVVDFSVRDGNAAYYSYR